MPDAFEGWSREHFVDALEPLEFADSTVAGRLLEAQKFVCAGCGIAVDMGSETISFMSFGLDVCFPVAVHAECRPALSTSGTWPRLRAWLEVVQNADEIAAAAKATLRAAAKAGLVVPKPADRPESRAIDHGDAPAPKRGPSPKPPRIS